jgi:hypothetical protein
MKVIATEMLEETGRNWLVMAAMVGSLVLCCYSEDFRSTTAARYEEDWKSFTHCQRCLTNLHHIPNMKLLMFFLYYIIRIDAVHY